MVTHIHLHANWENCQAQTLYKRCGFRCNQFTADGYTKPFETQFQFGHMIRMELNLNHIKNINDVCYNASAITISKEDEDQYLRLCQQARPAHLNGTCP
jgi:hypothetical protein